MVKERISFVNRSATVAWCPVNEKGELVAAGTVANAISDSFDASAALEIFAQDLDSVSGEMKLLGSVQTNERFHRLAWGVSGVDSGSLPLGMLAGGLVDGTVNIYNPAAMIK